jgi:hypothetical protein
MGHQQRLGELMGWFSLTMSTPGRGLNLTRGVAVLQGSRRPGGMILRDFLRLDDLIRMQK